MAKLIGRKKEIAILEKALQSDKARLIAVYGRRRVGKTFLVREVYQRQMVLEVMGIHRANLKDQIKAFTNTLNRAFNVSHETPESWFEAFDLLEAELSALKSKKKKVVFIDEFPWMATPRSKFLMAFENFWNRFCSKRDDLIVVICGSAASYMIKLINSRGGLHNRINHPVPLYPFNLHETKQFLINKRISYTDYDITQLYMVMGGIPEYLDKVERGKSVAQNIDQICFEKGGFLKDEFKRLFKSLFDNSDKHYAIIRALSSSNQGITRKQIIEKTKLRSGGDFSDKLEELEVSGFITEYPFYQNNVKKSLYRLSDEYSKFYLKYIEPNRNNGKGTWQRLQSSSSYKSWAGFSFESLCLKHIEQIKVALGIVGVYSTNNSWFNDNAQIDLLIDRDDNVISLCEIKFYNAPFSISKSYYLNLKNKVAELRTEVGAKKNIFIEMITTYGLSPNKYSNELVQNSIEIEALFKE